jgi:hypothetical protein
MLYICIDTCIAGSRTGAYADVEIIFDGKTATLYGKNYTTETGHELNGTVAPNGELDLRMLTGAGDVHSRPMELRTTAQTASAGTVHAQQSGGSCRYEYVWQKQQ